MDGTVLVADDDRTIRTVLTQALTRAGCRVRATGSVNTLWRWVEEGEGDAVVSDVMLPDGDGLELLPSIRRRRPGSREGRPHLSLPIRDGRDRADGGVGHLRGGVRSGQW